MKSLAVAAALATLGGCAASPSPDPAQDLEVVADAGAEAAPRVRTYCPVGERPVFFVGSAEECQTIRFDCPPTTHYVGGEACGCGCDPD